jgi:Flp pilus assembly pilin Flp
MKNLLLKLWKDEEGAELVEWVIVVSLVAAAAVAVYSQLDPALTGKLNDILENIGVS